MIFTGRHVGADEALEIGLVDRTMAPAEAYPAALEEARKFAEGPTAAYAAVKRTLQASLGGDLAPGLEVERDVFVPLFSTHDQEEGMRAFLEKREPRFEGR
jgi:enoyl-CoA hydratase/carnithine racemase